MDKALKQRLVGATVLIILAVIVLPMLLSGRSETLKQESRQIELPPQPDELSIETRRFPVGLPNAPAPSTVDGAGQAGNEQPDQQQAANTETDSVEASEPLSSGTSAAGYDQQSISSAGGDAGVNQLAEEPGEDVPVRDKVVSAPVTSVVLNSDPDEKFNLSADADLTQDSPRYLVQVASFSSEKNANALAGLLRADQLPVLMDVVDRPTGRLYRVRLGPYAERSAADAVVTSLRSKMTDLTPRVLDLRPSDSAPVSTPSDPLVRWVVQVGSFTSTESAEALVAELRLSGLPAYSEKVTAAKDTVYKVRIGPELDRDKAVALARKVKDDHQLDGFVTTED